MTHLKLIRLHPGRRSALPHAQQAALSRALGIPTRRRRPIYFPFLLSYPQIDAPQRLAPAVLQPFVEQRKSVFLVHPVFLSLPALLTAFDAQALHVTVPEPTRLRPYTRQRLFVVFPVLPQPAYVLPTRLEHIAAGRVTLTYQDPRHEPWRYVPSTGPLSVQLAPPSALAARDLYQLRVTRELSWRPGGVAHALEGELVDRVEDQRGVPEAGLDFFRGTPTWQGEIYDISCGGVCLFLPPDVRGPAAVQQLVSLCLRLPPVRLAATSEKVALTLRVLGTVRAVRTLPTDVALHVRFLDRLPEAFGRLFEQLEREAWGAP